MTKSIESKILIKSKKCGRGSVFFVGDFISYGNRDAVNKALERLVEKGQMLRVARGIYLSTAKRIAPFLKNEMRIFKEKRNAATM